MVVAVIPDPPPPKPTYTAVGQLNFRTPPPAFTSTGTELQQQGRSVSRDLLLSARVLQGVAQQLNFTPEQIVEIRDKEKIKIIFPGEAEKSGKNQKKNSDEVRPQAINLEYTDPKSATQAQAVLQAFMLEMVDYSRWLNTSQLRARIDALQKRLDEVRVDLTAAERKFYDYISQQGAELLAIQDGSLFSGITSSQQRQRELNLALQEVEGQIASLIQQLGLNPEQAYTAVALSADPILANLRNQILGIELQLERLRLDLRPEHPTIIRLLKEKSVNETLLQQRAQELIGDRGLASVPSEIRQESSLDPNRQQLASRLLVLQTQRAGLVKQIESVIKTEQELRDQYTRFPDRQLTQAKLVQAVEFQRVIYQNILTALVDAQAAEAETVGSLTIAADAQYRPSPPPTLTKKNRPLIVLIGSGAGVVAGFGVIFLLALLDDRLHSASELRNALAGQELSILGELPLISALAQEDENLVISDLDSIYLPFYERLRGNLRRMGGDSSRVILITSISPQEGKSLTAYNLAIASAYAGKRTLLIEADLRSPSQANFLDISPSKAASVEPLKYYAARSEAIQLVPKIPGLAILPSPSVPRQAAAILESSEFQLLLKDARGRFDMVIIDSPSLSQANDALLIEPLTDGLVLVTRPEVTRSSLLEEAVSQFEEAEVSVLGAVINGVETLVNPNLPPNVPSSVEPETPPAETVVEQEKVEV